MFGTREEKPALFQLGLLSLSEVSSVGLAALGGRAALADEFSSIDCRGSRAVERGFTSDVVALVGGRDDGTLVDGVVDHVLTWWTGNPAA